MIKYKYPEMLKKISCERKITIKQIAKDLELGESTLYNHTTGKATPSVNVLLDIANYLNVSLDYLVTGEKRNERIQIARNTKKTNEKKENNIQTVDR